MSRWWSPSLKNFLKGMETLGGRLPQGLYLGHLKNFLKGMETTVLTPTPEDMELPQKLP